MMNTSAVRDSGYMPARSPLQSLAEFQQCNSGMFAKLHTLTWFIKHNKAALVGGGALLVIAGRLFIDPDKFDVALRQIGAARVKVSRS